jgi:transposase
LGTATVSRWKSQYENEGTLTSAKKGGATYSIVTEEGKQFIFSEIENKNDITLAELKQKYLKKFNEIISGLTISQHLKKLNISRQKSFYDSNQDKKYSRKPRKFTEQSNYGSCIFS